MDPVVMAQALEPIVRKAGDILLSYYQKNLKCMAKESGFVTEADLACERYLIESLRPLIPQAAFYAEESGAAGSSDYCWVIDPLDGTTNFAHGIPFFCISVALTYQGKPIVGAIYQPLSDEFFLAFEGKGAFLNGKPIRVSTPSTIKTRMVVASSSYLQSTIWEKLARKLRVEDKSSISIRNFGSAALELAYLACGRIDGALFEGLCWWDVAAGCVIIHEAGSKVTDFEGGLITAESTSLVGAGAQIYGQLMALIKE